MARVVVRDVTKSYPLAKGQRRQALGGVSLTVEPGEFVCLLGPSGCGKTTLLNILAGLDTPDSGTVTIEGRAGEQPVTSYVFQEPRLLPWLTVGANLRFVLDEREGRDELIEHWLERVGLAGRAGDHPHQLSIGQRQRVAVARAMMIRPAVLFMDEPFSALDELTAGKVREELLSLWAEIGCSIVFVTHNPLEAAFLADRIVLLSPGPGHVVEELDVSSELSRPRDSDDNAVWSLSRQAVSMLSRGDKPSARS